MSRVRRLAINAADHLVGKNRLDAAASILENYLSAHAECAEVLQRLGRIRMAQGSPGVAVSLFERAIVKYSERGDESTPAACAVAGIAND